MKRQIWIGLAVLFFAIACSMSAGFPLLDGPNPKAQKSTLEKIQQAQASQDALIQTQVVAGVQALAVAASPSNSTNASSVAQNQPGEAQTKIAQKTAEIERLLTNIPTTIVPEASPTDESGGGFSASPAPEVDPKGSDGTDFTDATFKAFGQPNYYSYGISIDLKGPVGTGGGKNFILKVGDNLLEKCAPPLDYPNRLYCTGKPFQGGKLNIQVIENINGTQIVRFTSNYNFPKWTSTPLPATKRPKKGEEEEEL